MSVLLTLVFVVGIACLAYGCWLIYHPAGFVAAGVLLCLVPLWWARGAEPGGEL